MTQEQTALLATLQHPSQNSPTQGRYTPLLSFPPTPNHLHLPKPPPGYKTPTKTSRGSKGANSYGSCQYITTARAPESFQQGRMRQDATTCGSNSSKTPLDIK